MDWVIQLTLTHLGVLCVVEAFALGYCHKSLSHHRSSTPVLAVFIKLNWVELFLNQKAAFLSHFCFSTLPQWCCENVCVYTWWQEGALWCETHSSAKRIRPLLIRVVDSDLLHEIFPLICLVSWFQMSHFVSRIQKDYAPLLYHSHIKCDCSCVATTFVTSAVICVELVLHFCCAHLWSMFSIAKEI